MFARILKSTVINQNNYKLHRLRIVSNYPFQITQYQCDSNGNKQNGWYRYYKNLGHKPRKLPLITKLWCSFILTGFVLSLVDYKWYVMIFNNVHFILINKFIFRLKKKLFPSVKAHSETIKNDNVDEINQELASEDEEMKKKKHRREKIGFRDRKVSQLTIWCWQYLNLTVGLCQHCALYM